jgi:8-amino-7-oxononanoate synthase
LTLTLGQQLEEKGILVGVIRTPTVPKNTARLRVTISAAHTKGDIQQLLTALEQVHAS